MDGEELIAAVSRVRKAGQADSAADVFAVLESEGLGVTLSAVKKATSKAVKRERSQPAAAAPPPAAAAPVQSEKAKAKAEKAKAAEIKSAENAMMDAHRLLRQAKAGGDISQAATIQGTVEEFIQRAAARACSGVLEHGDKAVLWERIEADVATLEWIRLTSAAGAISFKEDVFALGGELQLARLKEVRGTKDRVAALECFVDSPATDDYRGAAVDREIAKADARAARARGVNAIDDVD